MQRLACAFVVTVIALAAQTVQAAGQRSFVATSGVDNPSCSLASPCRTFGAAITATSAGGEIIVLDSGGYGQVTIAQSVSIVAPPGIYAGISVSSGHGVTIAAAATDTVVLHGLVINNQGSTGRGIYITGAAVVRVEDVQVSGFTNASGLNATPGAALQLHVRRSVFRRNNYGLAINYQNPSATMQVTGTLEEVEISNNNIDGLGIGNNTFMSLSRSIITKSGQVGVGFTPDTGQVNRLDVDDCEISANNIGMYPGDTPGPTLLQLSRSRIVENATGLFIGNNSTTRVSDNVIASNSQGVHIIPGGVIESAGSNVLRGNTSDEPVLATFPLR